jgi:F-type H+-transporting ATPase subunit gamma
MPSLQQTRRRIASVKNTQKITKAMKLVSAAKLRRAQDRIVKARPYALKMGALLSNLGARVSRDVHPLLARRPIRKVELVVVAADRGLCGSFNASIFRRATDALGAPGSGTARSRSRWSAERPATFPPAQPSDPLHGGERLR